MRIQLLSLLIFWSVSCKDVTIDLGGSDWIVRNSNGSISTQANVPGDVFGDLLRAKILGDPLYRYNDDVYRWVSYENWTFSKSFDIPTSVLSNDQILLVCEGLDTVASISINGFPIGSTNNMFRSYKFSVKSFLKAQGNVIQVSFLSSATYAQNMYNAYPYSVPWSPTVDEIPYRHFIRREQCSFGWDWGPSFVTHGIWRPISLLGVTGAALESATPIVTPLSSDLWQVTANAHFIATKPTSGTLQLAVAGSISQVNLQLPAGDSDFSVLLTIPSSSVDLWWPNGKGEHPLYPANVTWTSIDGSSDSITKNIGFRNLTLVQQPYTDPSNVGKSFYFEVNGIPIFAKGANWIPADMFESRVTPDRLFRLLDNAVAANMNIIRNWGGGIYQSEEFYDYCDRNGLMVWEEFMFACAMYPRDTAFLQNVEEEVKYQVNRLAHHTSIVLWAGNNENEGALWWFPETRANRDLYLVDQVALYISTVRSTILANDNTRPFLYSSPTNGPLVEEPYVLMWGNVQDTRYGDVHFYDYEFLCTNESAFPDARFVSEYGWQSYPSYYSWKDVALTSDLSLNSSLMSHRQHHPDGNTQIWAQILKHFKEPKPKSDPVASFKDVVYLTQSVQAFCIRAQTEHYRRNKDLSFNTMGALYWQFNDVWQAPTWSSLEYSGRWKMLHYFVKKFFAEVFISSFVSGTNYNLKIVNDLPVDVSGTINSTVYAFSDSSVIKAISMKSTVPKLGALTVPFQLSSLLCKSNGCYQPENAFVLLSFIPDNSDIEVSDNFYFFSALNQVALPRTNLKATNFVQTSQTEISFTVVASAASPLIWIESPLMGYFSDNGFTLAGNSAKSVAFYSYDSVSVSDFASSLSLTTIVNTYQ